MRHGKVVFFLLSRTVFIILLLFTLTVSKLYKEVTKVEAAEGKIAFFSIKSPAPLQKATSVWWMFARKKWNYYVQGKLHNKTQKVVRFASSLIKLLIVWLEAGKMWLFVVKNRIDQTLKVSAEIREIVSLGGLEGSDESGDPLTDNKNFGLWLFLLGVEVVKDFTLLVSGDGVILHQNVYSKADSPTSKKLFDG